MFNNIQGNVACYARVSTDDQAERGTIQAQIDFANKYCDMYGLNIYKIYCDEGVSGTVPFEERPSAAELLTDAKEKKFDTLLVFKLDRLGRSTRIIINTIYDLEQLGIKLKSMTEPFDTGDASGRFLLTILAGVADLERSNILQRMWLGSNRAAKEGKWLGGIVPYGYLVDADNRLYINDNIIPAIGMSEADVVRLMFEYVASGKSLISCADYVNSLGIPTHYNLRGHTGKRIKSTTGKWRPNRIGNIIRNTIYKGVHFYGKRTEKQRELIERSTPAIISVELWDKAQKVVTDNFIRSRRSSKHDYLLRGLISCENCGSNYHGTVRDEEKNQRYYVCNRRTSYKTHGIEKCWGKSVDMTWLDNLVWNACLNYINSPDVILKEIEEQEKLVDTDKLVLEKNSISMQLLSKDKERDNLLTLFRKNLISLTDVEKQLQDIEHEAKTLSIRQKEIETEISTATQNSMNKLTVQTLFAELQEMIKEDDFNTRQEVINILVEKVYIKTEYGEKEDKVTIRIKFNFSPSSVISSPSYTLQGQSFCLQLDKMIAIEVGQYSRMIVKPTDNRAKRARLEAKLKVKQLALLLAVTVPTITNAELNRYKMSIEVARKYAAFFKKPVGYFLEADQLPSATLAQRIKKARLTQGLTQQKLAEKLKIQVCTIRSWEKERSQPNKRLASLINEFIGSQDKT